MLLGNYSLFFSVRMGQEHDWAGHQLTQRHKLIELSGGDETKCQINGLVPGLTSQRHSALISSDSEYFQVCFSAVHYLKISEQRWFSSEQRWKRKFSELKISPETALFQRWFSLKQSWFSLKQHWNTKVSEQKNQRWISGFSADFPWKRADTHWRLLKQLSSFLTFPWDNAEHPETSYSFSANFCRKVQILSFPGNLETIPSWQN